MDKWHQHIETLARRVEKLNQLNFKTLHYTNSLGTDLTVELPEGHIWEAGNDVTLSGRTYIANIPTEEVLSLIHISLPQQGFQGLHLFQQP